MRILRKVCSASVAASLFLTSAAAAQDSEPSYEPPSKEDAPIALLVDMTSGQTLFARNAERRFAPASITKVMTAYVAFDMLLNGELKRNQVMRVRPDTFQEWSRKGSTMYLAHDAQPTVDQLLHGITTISANDGSVVLAEGAAGSLDKWLVRMNRTAARLGMENSHFGTPNGWPDEGRTYTTARDLATLAEALIRRFPFSYNHFFGNPSYTYEGITQYNHDPISGEVPGADGLKTGFTNQAGYGFLGSAERYGRRLILVVGTADRPRERNRAAVDLLEWGFGKFQLRKAFKAGEAVGYAQVQGGDRAVVPLAADRAVAVTFPQGDRPEVTMRIIYDGPLSAPIAEGEPVARLVVQVEGFEAQQYTLRAGEGVAQAGSLRRALNGIVSWLT